VADDGLVEVVPSNKAIVKSFVKLAASMQALSKVKSIPLLRYILGPLLMVLLIGVMVMMSNKFHNKHCK